MKLRKDTKEKLKICGWWTGPAGSLVHHFFKLNNFWSMWEERTNHFLMKVFYYIKLPSLLDLRSAMQKPKQWKLNFAGVWRYNLVGQAIGSMYLPRSLGIGWMMMIIETDHAYPIGLVIYYLVLFCLHVSVMHKHNS